ncbi:MAG: hypothetical protein HGB12_01885 [Bacteroidetes bacterium]|nr:hypothetical protein [Bacteroidota bacterium]
MKIFKKKYLVQLNFLFLFLLVFTCGFSNSGAQNDIDSQKELKKQADNFFRKEEYSSTLTLYSRLVSIYPKDPVYNYRLGVSMLFADSREIKNTVKYLEFAASKSNNVDVKVFYYLGLAYQQSYRYLEAVSSYNSYIKLSGNTKVADVDINNQIAMCKNAKEQLKSLYVYEVVKKTEVPYKDFFRSYDVQRFGGVFILKPDYFKTPYDKKHEKISLCFFSKENKEAYFSSYGVDGKKGKDIYKAERLADGNWSKAVSLGNIINTEYDEDFPFLLPDGVTLYYSSKGKTSLGGYDIFTSTMNEEGVWDKPTSLNFPINSPFDDITFVPDSNQRYAYFSSTRQCSEDMINVYKIRIDKKQEVVKPLEFEKPEMLANIKESAYEQTLKYLNEESKLDVNSTEIVQVENKKNAEEKIIDLNEVTQKDDLYKITDNIENKDIIIIAENQYKQELSDLKKLQSKRDAAKTIAQNYKNQVLVKNNEAESVSNNINAITDVDAKQNEAEKLNNLNSEIDALNQKSLIAQNISDNMDEQITIKQKNVSEAEQYSSDIKTNVKANLRDSSIALLNRMTDNIIKSTVDTSFFASDNSDLIENIKKESDEYAEKAKLASDEAASLKEKAKTYRSDASNPKMKNKKQQILQKAKEFEKEAITKQKEADAALTKSEKLLRQIDTLKLESLAYSDVVSDITNINKNTSANEYASINSTAKVVSKTPAVSTKTPAATAKTTTKTPAANNKATTTTTKTATKTPAVATKNTASNKSTAKNAQAGLVKKKSTPPDTIVKKISTPVLTAEQKRKNDLIVNLDKLVISAQADADSLKAQYEKIYALASEKYNSGLKNFKEAENLKAEASEISNTEEKEKNLTKATSLQKEAEISTQQSVVLFNIAKKLESSYINKKDNIDAFVEQSTEVKNLVNENKIDEAESMYAGLIETPVTKTNTDVIYNSYNIELNDSLQSKEKELNLAKVTLVKLKYRTDSLQKKANLLKNEKNKTKKAEKIEKIRNMLKQVEEQIAIENSDATNLGIEVDRLKIRIDYSSKFTDETAKAEIPSVSTADKNELEKQIVEYDSKKNISEKAEVANVTNVTNQDSEKENTEKEVSPSTSNTKKEKNENTSDVNNANKKTNINAEENKQVNENNETPKTLTDTESLAGLNLAEQTEAKAVLLDQTVTIINNNISAIQSQIEKETNAVKKAKLNKEILSLQNEAASLKQKASAEHENAKKANDSKEITTVADVNYMELAAGMESEALNISDNVSQLRSDAAGETNAIEKAKILAEADEYEITSNLKQLEAFKIYELANTNEYYSNVLKISKLKVTDDNNAELATASLLEDESKENFEKAQALRKSIKDKMTFTQKTAIIQDASAKEQVAFEKQLKAIDIYAKYSTTASNITKNETDNNVIPDKPNVVSESDVNKEPDVKNESRINKETEVNKESDVNKEAINKESNINNESEINKEPLVNNESDVNKEPVNKESDINKESDVNNNSDINKKIVINKNTDIDNNSDKNNTENEAQTETNNNTKIKITDNNITENNNTENEINLLNNKNVSSSASAFNPGTEFKGIFIKSGNVVPNNTDGNNLVPVDPGLPSTIVFKVQIAAMREHVSPAQFAGISPITAENSNLGFIRYLAGLFAKYDDANTSKNQLRALGYNGAFVVAYLNGKRISILQALAALKTDNSLATSYSDLNNTNYFSKKSNIETATNTANATSGISNVPSVTNIKGLIFSVQVGAYTKPVTAEQLYNAPSLYEEVLPNGTHRYLSGTYTSLQEAIDAKNDIRNKGSKDAFVVAYSNGKKITIAEAKLLMENK